MRGCEPHLKFWMLSYSVDFATTQHSLRVLVCVFDVIYDTRYYFNVRSKADISQLNLPHGTDN